MNSEKTLEKKIIENNEIINSYKEQLETSKEKIKQINSKQNSLILVKMKKSVVENIGGFIVGLVVLIGLKIVMPSLTTAFEKISTTFIFLTASLAAMAVQVSETKELNKKTKENPYYNDFKDLSKKERVKKKKELELEKNHEEENIESLKNCIEVEQEELSNLISKMSFRQTLKETVGKELEKSFLRYLEEVSYKDISFENQPVDKVKIKTKTR